MNKLILFCVETRSNADTDWQYIQGTIKYFYQDNRKIVRRCIYLKSKTRYRSNTVLNTIAGYRKKFPNNNVTVIYCIDIDDYDKSSETKILLDEIVEYCEKNHYDFVYFCKDIEDVFWGHQVNKKDKKSMAASFNAKHQINSINESQLRRTTFTKNSSNILVILDKYFKKK